jgi:hypothetical protein
MHSPVARPGLGGSLVYVSLSVFNAALTFALTIAFTVAGIGSTLVWIGVPILVFATAFWRAAAQLERRWMRVTLGADIAEPYRVPAPGAGWIRRWGSRLADPATWRDLAYLVLRLPMSIAGFALTVVLWMVPLALISLPIVIASGGGELTLPSLSGGIMQINTAVKALPFAVAGLPLLFLPIALTRRIAQLEAVIASALLRPTRMTELSAEQ